MQSKAEKKVIFTDNGQDKAVTGIIVAEDDFFITLEGKFKTYRIGKKAIVCIEEVPQ